MGTYLEAFTEAIKPEKRLSISEWAESYRILPQSTSAEPGKYRTSRVPYAQELMDIMSSHRRDVDTVIVQKGAQLGISEVLNNITGYIIDHSPSPTLYLLGSLELARRASRQRIEPMIDAIPRIKGKIPKAKSGQGTNTALERSFSGGHLLMAGSNSTNALRQYSARYVLLDELDGFAEATSEGNPIDLAIARTGGFSNRRKIMMISTPTIQGDSRIESEFEHTDKRYYHVPCPQCGHKQALVWSQMKYEDDKPETVYYECEQCEFAIEEKHKTSMLRKGEWIPTAEAKRKGLRGYHINALYSPFKSWKLLVQEWLSAKKNADKLQVFINTVLAETWQTDETEVDPESLLARREAPWEKVPQRCLFLVGGVDVQENRLEVNILGWGKGNECWPVDYQVIYGDPREPGVWEDLDRLLQKTYQHESGRQMKISGTGIDAGYATDVVYEYVRNRSSLRVFAFKGVAGFNRPLVGKPKKRQIRTGVTVDLFDVAVDLTKTQIYSMLRTKEEGAGYFHLPRKEPFNEDWISSLTAERLRTFYINGKRQKKWRLKNVNARNEVLDTSGYCYAVFHMLNPDLDSFEAYFSGDSEEAPKRKRKRKPKIVTKSAW